MIVPLQAAPISARRRRPHMNYLESVVYIESLSPTLKTPCLERVQAFMTKTGDLHERMPVLHVGGTNGKGSTVAMLDSVLRRAGLKVGRFTGPHLLNWNERFHADGEPIPDDCFAELATRVRRLSEDFGRRHPQFGPLTWFEFLTAMAFFYFADSKVDIAVMEVGLGGRWDATNVISSPLACAITNVDLDHTHILGDTVSQIAREKAGIIKAGAPVVTAAEGDALAEIVAAARASRSAVFQCAPPAAVVRLEAGARAAADPLFDPADLDRLLPALERLSLAGIHQRVNALVAIGVLLTSGLTGEFPGDQVAAVADGLASVYWPGRLQYLPDLRLVLDGAHNPAGARALRRALDELFPGCRRSFVLGCFQNKDVARFVNYLMADGDRFYACEAATRRAVVPAEAIVELAGSQELQAVECASVAQALDRALSERRPGDLVVATGSLAVVKEAMIHLGWGRVEDGAAHTLMNWTEVAGLVST